MERSLAPRRAAVLLLAGQGQLLPLEDLVRVGPRDRDLSSGCQLTSDLGQPFQRQLAADQVHRSLLEAADQEAVSPGMF